MVKLEKIIEFVNDNARGLLTIAGATALIGCAAYQNSHYHNKHVALAELAGAAVVCAAYLRNKDNK
jgi:hypothetical protein